ncbi:MAG TPA: hypothetical protein VGR32_05630 [Brevundimonas sp.]|jgi:hypothetical protein|uniref:hypothetical protein n=1 Tax=Brevundimonas sp. TaxID=1871086 RepID=UPI002DE8F7C6|nr:hypothetical protein [Brevundimonas sp.]
MRIAAVTTAVLIAAGLSGHVAAQDRPPAYTNAEACLEANVDAAVAASSGAADAAEFLLEYLCAEPVSYASAYERNSAALATMTAMLAGIEAEVAAGADAYMDPVAQEATTEDVDVAAMFAGTSVDPVTGAIVTAPDAAMGGAFGETIAMQAAMLSGQDGHPVFLRQLAGRLVMARRR